MTNYGIQAQESLKRCTRVSKLPSRFMDFVMLIDVSEISCYHEVISLHDHAKWMHPMYSELDCIHNNETWDLLSLPNGRKTLPCKWVYKHNYTIESIFPK